MKFFVPPLALLGLFFCLLAAGPLCAHQGTGDVITGSIVSGGLTRDYLIYKPKSYQLGTPVPLVFNIHGTGMDDWWEKDFADMTAIADTANFLLVYPNGTVNIDPVNKDRRCFNTYNTGSTVDDVGFISDLLTELQKTYTIDANRVYSCGFSNGGFMSYKLACQLGNRIAAVAAVSGAMVKAEYNACNPQHPTPILDIHSDDDPTIHYAGHFNGYGYDDNFLSTPYVLKYWVGKNQCAPTYDSTAIPGVNRREWRGSTQGSRVLQYELATGGHNWFTNDYINSGAAVWRFLRQFQLNHLQDKASTPPTNLALNKPVVVSSLEKSSLPAAAAVDNNLDSRWGSVFADQQWLYVDLGASYTVNEVKLTWNYACAQDYDIQVSPDALTWTTIKSVTGNSPATPVNDYTSFTNPSTGRYVRMNGKTRATPYGFSMNELEVYGTPAAPLPVTLVRFTAEPVKANAVQLAWTTASELNSARFEVERSLDKRTFTSLGQLPAAGTSLTSQAYQYLDAALPASTPALYYRLRQVDLDGSATYSPVRAVYVAEAGGLRVFPNPARQAVTVLGAAGGAPVEVFDVMGRLVLSLRADATGQATLSLPAGRPPGAYLVRSGPQTTHFMTE